MRQNLSTEDLVEYFTLTPGDAALLEHKSRVGRLGFAILLKIFQRDLRFPAALTEVPAAAVAYVAKQAGGSMKYGRIKGKSCGESRKKSSPKGGVESRGEHLRWQQLTPIPGGSSLTKTRACNADPNRSG